MTRRDSRGPLYNYVDQLSPTLLLLDYAKWSVWGHSLLPRGSCCLEVPRDRWGGGGWKERMYIHLLCTVARTDQHHWSGAVLIWKCYFKVWSTNFWKNGACCAKFRKYLRYLLIRLSTFPSKFVINEKANRRDVLQGQNLAIWTCKNNRWNLFNFFS